MSLPIQGSQAGFDLARKLAISDSSNVSLVRGLGSGARLSFREQANLLTVRLKSLEVSRGSGFDFQT